MAFELLRSLMPSPAVHAKPDVAHVNPDGQNRQGKSQQSKRERQDEDRHPQPVPNIDGQITGKEIDTTA